MNTDSLKERLYKKSVVLPTGCVEWAGYRQAIGYGIIGTGSRTDGSRRTMLTHRAAWEVAYGPIPDGVMVCHKCDNRACINPEHLFLGNQTDNMRDMIAKGRKRVAKGETHPKTKIDKALAERIREQHHNGCSQNSIAKEHGISQYIVWRVINHQHWTDRS